MGIIYLKNTEQQELCRKAGVIAAKTLSLLPSFVIPGVTTNFIDSKAEEIVKDLGGFPACKDYVHGDLPPYPGSICINVNDEAVHTCGSERIIKEGDLVKLDLVVDFQGFKADTAISVLVPPIDPLVLKFAQTGCDALFKGIEKARDGNKVSDISFAIEDFIRPTGYSVSRIFTGHGIGRGIHESPSVPSFYSREHDSLLCEGLILAIEPILFMSSNSDVIMEGWNTRSKDGAWVCHWEHSVLITKTGCEILTLRNEE
jgi:methionyl aminopeptidase